MIPLMHIDTTDNEPQEPTEEKQLIGQKVNPQVYSDLGDKPLNQ